MQIHQPAGELAKTRIKGKLTRIIPRSCSCERTLIFEKGHQKSELAESLSLQSVPRCKRRPFARHRNGKSCCSDASGGPRNAARTRARYSGEAKGLVM